MQIPIPILLVITVFACFFGNVIRKYFSGKFPGNACARQVYVALSGFVSMVALICMGGFGETSLFTFLFAILFGAVTAVQMTCNLKAYELGPLSYTTVIITLSTLIPALSGAIFWDEKITPLQIVGMVFMVVCIVLSVNSDSGAKKTSLKWLIYCALSFLLCGSVGVMQKIHQTSSHKDELNSFLIIAFAFSVVFSALSAIIIYFKDKKKADASADNSWFKKVVAPKILIFTAIAGVSAAINNKLNLHLSGVMDSAVFFPVINGAGLVLAAIGGIVLFREKLSLKQWIGFFAGIVSVILLVL